jgi:hypothetical protein
MRRQDSTRGGGRCGFRTPLHDLTPFLSSMRTRALFLVALPLVAGLAMGQSTASSSSPFIVKPYLQIGDAATTADPTTMALLWQSDTTTAKWDVETKAEGSSEWMPMRSFWPRRMAAPGLAAYDIYEGTLGSFAPGSTFAYRVKRNGTIVFSATGHARKGPTMPYRFVVFGDAGVNGDGQKAIAYRAYLEHPDFVAIPGDIVYGAGKMSEYRTNFFPIYNADTASPTLGAPFERSVPFVAALGNHDAGYSDSTDTVHDQWGYFAFWSMPRNGPYTKPGRNTPVIYGDSALSLKLGAMMRQSWPQMANYSFDYGNAHWLVLDANEYVNWTDPVLRNWVARDLAGATHATWKFVMFHQPGFNSSRAHFEEQQMRLTADLFEAGGVDVVFTGHVHNYQRSYPLTFVPDLAKDPKVVTTGGVLHEPDYYWNRKDYTLSLPFTIDGNFTLDKEYDGVRRTVPHGVIYIVSGGGGAGLYTPEQTGEVGSWQPFTKTLIADRHSFSVVDISGRTFTMRQIAEDGSVIDKFVVTKPGSVVAATPQQAGSARSSGR